MQKCIKNAIFLTNKIPFFGRSLHTFNGGNLRKGKPNRDALVKERDRQGRYYDRLILRSRGLRSIPKTLWYVAATSDLYILAITARANLSQTVNASKHKPSIFQVPMTNV